MYWTVLLVGMAICWHYEPFTGYGFHSYNIRKTAFILYKYPKHLIGTWCFSADRSYMKCWKWRVHICLKFNQCFSVSKEPKWVMGNIHLLKCDCLAMLKSNLDGYLQKMRCSAEAKVHLYLEGHLPSHCFSIFTTCFAWMIHPFVLLCPPSSSPSQSSRAKRKKSFLLSRKLAFYKSKENIVQEHTGDHDRK